MTQRVSSINLGCRAKTSRCSKHLSAILKGEMVWRQNLETETMVWSISPTQCRPVAKTESRHDNRDSSVPKIGT